MKLKAVSSILVVLIVFCACGSNNQNSSDSTSSKANYTSWKGAFIYLGDILSFTLYENGIIEEINEDETNLFLKAGYNTSTYTQDGNTITFVNCHETTAEIREFEGEEILVITRKYETEFPEYPMFKDEETAEKYLEQMAELTYENIQGSWSNDNNDTVTITETEFTIDCKNIILGNIIGSSEYEITPDSESYYGISVKSDIEEIKEIVFTSESKLLVTTETIGAIYLTRVDD